MFKINEVLKWQDQLYRILDINNRRVVWICLEDKIAFPTLISSEYLIQAMDNEELLRFEDPYQNDAYTKPELGSLAQIKRDENYNIINELIHDKEFLEGTDRHQKILKASLDHSVTKQTIYRLIRRYWQRGQTPNTLLPDYKNSGGKDKKKTQTNKLGRPREINTGKGVVIDETVGKLFRISIEKHLLISKDYTIAYAYRKFLSQYKTYYPSSKKDAVPTQRQFQYFYHREYPLAERIEKRTSTLEYNKDIRPLSSTANANVLGPGSRYEIDATIADIYLVAEDNRQKIIGRPIVYLVIDVFSRMVTGFYIGLENPSYVAAMQALSIAISSKISICKQYGIPITEEQWPSVGLPNAILADRGELLGHQIESLEQSFSVRIENAPPFRGDAKGIVERHFRTIQAKFKPFAPGVVTNTIVKKRGGKDYRLDAKLTMATFTEIILVTLIHHNNFKVLDQYDRDADMPDDLSMTPVSLWNWGIQHRMGKLRLVSEHALRMSLLPRTQATLSNLGLKVFGAYYMCTEMIEAGWLHRKQESRRNNSFEVAYDPNDAKEVYLFNAPNSLNHWVCRLSPRSRAFEHCSFWEVWQKTIIQKKTVAKDKLEETEQQRKFEDFLERKLKIAGLEQPSTDFASDRKRISEIKQNRADEKDAERKNGARSTSASSSPKTDTYQDKILVQDEDYSYPELIDELFSEDQ